MKYTAFWYRFPHGNEWEPMFSQYREFESLEKAIQFIQRKAEKTRGIYWAGAHVEDDKGGYVYDMSSEYDETWYKHDIEKGA